MAASGARWAAHERLGVREPLLAPHPEPPELAPPPPRTGGRPALRVHVRPRGAAPREPTRAAAAAAAAASGRRSHQRRSSRAAVPRATLARARVDRPRVRKRDVLPGASVQAIRRAHLTRQGRMRRHGDARRYCMPQAFSQRSRHWRNKMVARRVATCPTVEAVDVIKNRRKTYVNVGRQVNARKKTGPWILAAQAAGYLLPGKAFKPLPRRHTPEWRQIRHLVHEMPLSRVVDEPQRPVVAGGHEAYRVRLPAREMGLYPYREPPPGPQRTPQTRRLRQTLAHRAAPLQRRQQRRQRTAGPAAEEQMSPEELGAWLEALHDPQQGQQGQPPQQEPWEPWYISEEELARQLAEQDWPNEPPAYGGGGRTRPRRSTAVRPRPRPRRRVPRQPPPPRSSRPRRRQTTQGAGKKSRR